MTCLNDPPNIRVLFVITDMAGGGAERVVLNVMRHVNRERFTPSLFLLRNSGAYWDEIPEDVRPAWGFQGSGRIVPKLLPVWRRLVQAVRQCDLVIGALELLPSYLAYAAASTLRKPKLAWVHTDIERHLPIYGAARVHRALIRWIYSRFDSVVFPSASALQAMKSVVTLDARAAKVIPNPSDIPTILRKGAAPLPDTAAGIFIKPTVLGAGRLVNAHKGFDILIKGHALARRLGCDHNLAILGEGPDRGALERLARDLNVAESVYFRGFEPNPYPFLKAAKLLALPSRFEAFGIVVTEAMTLGVPVIVAGSALGAIETIENGLCGRVFPAEDSEALASQICESIDGEAASAIYVQAGLRRAQSYNSCRIVKQWEDLFCQMARSASH